MHSLILRLVPFQLTLSLSHHHFSFLSPIFTFLALRTLPPLPGLPSQYLSSGSMRPLLFPYPLNSSSPAPTPASSPTSQPLTQPTPSVAASPHSPQAPPQTSRYELLIESLTEFHRSLHSTDPSAELFQGEEGQGDDEEEKEEAEADPKQEAYDMILNIIERSVYFLSTYDVNAQVLVMATLSAAFTRLANNRKLLLPAVHKIWPVIMNRMKEQKQLLLQSFTSSNSFGRTSFLLPYLLDFVTLLSVLCGDFLSLKLKVPPSLPSLFPLFYLRFLPLI
jgi:hypothetical protein